MRFARGETNLSAPGTTPGLGRGLIDFDGNVLELYGGKDICGTGLWGISVEKRRRKCKTYLSQNEEIPSHFCCLIR